MLTESFRPRRDTTAFIEWDRRELITYADFAANMALDFGQEWTKQDRLAIEEANRNDSNFRLCADGAYRKNGQSGARIAMFVYAGGKGSYC